MSRETGLWDMKSGESSESDLERVVAVRQEDSRKVIPLSDVEKWMNSDDPEVMGATAMLISDRKYYSRIVPPLEFKPYHRFFLRYYEKCIRDDPRGEWVNSRHSAGEDIVGWFIALWDNPSIPRSTLVELRDWLAHIFKTSDEKVKDVLIGAMLEHLFERHDIKQFFVKWKGNPILKEAYLRAAEWAESQPPDRRW